MNSFYVYIVQEVKASATAPVKIGVSNNVERRLEYIQVHNPREIQVRAVLGPFSKSQAYETERHLHEKLSCYRLRGEWFSGKVMSLIFRNESARSCA